MEVPILSSYVHMNCHSGTAPLNDENVPWLRNHSPNPQRSEPSTQHYFVYYWRFHQIALLSFIVLLSGCLSSPEIIEELRTLPQDNSFYLNRSTANQDAVNPEKQRQMVEDFRRHFFLPWHQDTPSNTRDDLTREFARYRSNPGYGENSRKHTGEWLEELARNADLASYPNARFAAVTIDHSDLRMLPTLRPHFSSLKADGTGYPFDNLQNSAVPANTPIYVAHVSQDKSWVLADSHYGSGWLPVRDVAAVDPKLIALWEDSDQVVLISDGVPVYDDDGKFLFKTNLGAQFPKLDDDEKNYQIMVARADEHRTAQLRRGIIPRNAAVAQPMSMTPANIAAMSNELINKPYGWGGLYQNRDCSAMLKDLFAPFGLWLPRHSTHQAREGGTFIDLSSLTPEDKERTILERGIPFLTLLWLKGHVMLYIGNQHDRAIVFHNFWGIKTRDLWGREGRQVVGHAAITTLRPGAELPYFQPPSDDLLNRVEGMTLLVGEK
jgi:cell wall-associated NlpC family hydrolase